jgi:hypothetical protein
MQFKNTQQITLTAFSLLARGGILPDPNMLHLEHHGVGPISAEGLEASGFPNRRDDVPHAVPRVFALSEEIAEASPAQAPTTASQPPWGRNQKMKWTAV